MFHFLQFRSNFLNPRFDLDEASALLHGRDQHDGFIKSLKGLLGFCFGDHEGSGLLISGLLTGNEETAEIVDVGDGDTELFLGIVEKTSGVGNSLSAGSSGTIVELDLASILREKLIALSSLHVVGGVGFGLFSSHLLGELIDKSEDITNHSVSGKVKL